MPTYEYRCDSCAKNFDVVQSFHDEPLTVCPTCGSPVKKVFGSVGIVFKGSGFYKTDSRSGSSASKTADPSPPADKSPAGSGGSDASSAAATPPAPTPSAPADKGAAAPSSAATTT